MIYVVRAGEYYKIGHSDDVAGRIQALQTASPETVELVLEIEGGVSDERELHRKLKPCRVRGEWFALSEKELRWLAGYLPETNKAPRPKRMRFKQGGCAWCAKRMYYDGDGTKIKCECGTVTDINEMPPEKRKFYVDTINWYLRQ